MLYFASFDVFVFFRTVLFRSIEFGQFPFCFAGFRFMFTLSYFSVLVHSVSFVHVLLAFDLFCLVPLRRFVSLCFVVFHSIALFFVHRFGSILMVAVGF